MIKVDNIYGPLIMSNDEYHKNTAIGSTKITMCYKRSPSHAFEGLEPTESMKFGTAIHCALLEPNKFLGNYVALSKNHNGRTNAGKAEKECIESALKVAIKYDEMRYIYKIISKIKSNKSVAKILSHKTHCEKSFFSEIDGLKVKVRPDILIYPCEEYPTGLIVDLKSTVDASLEGFGRAIAKYAMHVQAAYYSMIIASFFHQKDLPEFYWIAQEKTEPFCNAVYVCNDEIKQMGLMVVNDQIEIIKECVATGLWPGYSQDVLDAQLPNWAYAEFENDLNIK